MSRTNSWIACLQKPIQIGTAFRDRTESSSRESSPRSLQKPKTSTKTTRTFYRYKNVTSTTCQIQDDKDPTILKTVHRNHLVEFYPEEETLPPMIEKFVPMDLRHDDFYERLMEQRIQKLKNSEPPSIKDSLPGPIEPLRTAPVTLPRKRGSFTTSYSGDNSPLVLSPAAPVKPDNLQPYLIPPTSGLNLPTGPLTLIQQFIKYSRKSENSQPKYNHSQPNHPDPESVLRARTRHGYNFRVFFLSYTPFCMLTLACLNLFYEIFIIFVPDNIA